MFTLRDGHRIEQTPHTTLATLLASGVGGQMAMEARGRLVAAAIPPMVHIAGIVYRCGQRSGRGDRGRSSLTR